MSIEKALQHGNVEIVKGNPLSERQNWMFSTCKTSEDKALEGISSEQRHKRESKSQDELLKDKDKKAVIRNLANSI